MLNHVDLKTLDLGLSDSKPLHAGYVVHKRRFEALYDMHYVLEMGVVLKGRMQREYDGYKHVLGPGDLWFNNIWEPHGGRIVQAPCEVLVFMAWPALLHNLRFEEAPDFNALAPFVCAPRLRPQSSSPAKRRQLLEHARRGRALFKASEPERSLRLRLMFYELLVLAQKEWTAPSAEADLKPVTFKNLDRAVNLVFDNRRLVTKAEAAKACGLSRNGFDQTFSALMGMTFKEFGLRYRVSRVAAALKESDHPLKQLADEWGFVDASHLNRCFKRFYGMPAAKFRAG